MGRRIFLILLLSFSFVAGFSQKSAQPKLSYKLLSIRVTGASQLRDDQIIAASGLRPGQFAGENDFKDAMQRLGETGLFTNLTYSFHYSSDGCDVQFQVAENPELAPIVFDNLVWFSDDDLLSQLHSRLPLFTGKLPAGGNLADQVSDALNTILKQRNIAGKAEYLRAGKTDGPIDFYLYKVDSHPVVIRNMAFPGASEAELPTLEAAAEPLSGQEYLRSKMRSQENVHFLPVYLSRGYLKANFSDAEAKIAEDGPRTLVDVSFPVTPGLQYKLTGIQWQGNTVFPTEKLQEIVPLKSEEPANAVQLNDDLETVKKLYGTKGYLLARVDPAPQMDDAQATVRYQLTVTEGDQYRMGDLELDGLDADATKKMQAQWQLKKGDPYDDSYLPRFFKIMYRDVGLRRPYSVVPRKTVNPQDKTVNVALHFMPKT